MGQCKHEVALADAKGMVQGGTGGEGRAGGKAGGGEGGGSLRSNEDACVPDYDTDDIRHKPEDSISNSEGALSNLQVCRG